MVFNQKVTGSTEVVNHLWKGHQKKVCVQYIAVLLGNSGLLQWVAVEKGLKTTGIDASVKIRSDIWTHSPQYCCRLSVKLLKIHMWVVAKRETVIEGINIINSPASKIFQAHVLLEDWRNHLKNHW